MHKEKRHFARTDLHSRFVLHLQRCHRKIARLDQHCYLLCFCGDCLYLRSKRIQPPSGMQWQTLFDYPAVSDCRIVCHFHVQNASNRDLSRSADRRVRHIKKQPMRSLIGCFFQLKYSPQYSISKLENFKRFPKLSISEWSEFGKKT